MSFYEINGIEPDTNTFRFPAVEIIPRSVLYDDPGMVWTYIGELETALAQCESVIERLNTDRQEARRMLRMRDYLEGMPAR